MRAIHAYCGAWLCAMALPSASAAQAGGTLLEQINAYRSDAPACKGATTPDAAPGPLSPEPALTSLPFGAGRDLRQALRERGYAASRLQVLTLAGPADPTQAMDILSREYCTALLDPRFSAAGISRSGSQWQVVLAQPLLQPDLGDWRTAGKRVLKEVNAARSEARRCGGERYPAAGPLAWDEELAQAARSHSNGMAEHAYLAHAGRDGSSVGTRARRAGYEWQRIGENIAAGQGSADQVVAGWLSSPGHCANIMNPEFTEMGAAYATNLESDAAIYWTQVLGKPR